MRAALLPALIVALGLATAAAAQPPQMDCPEGVYRSPDGAGLVAMMAPALGSPPGARYTLVDGRRGYTGDAASPVLCQGGAVRARGPADGPAGAPWTLVPMRETAADFLSHGVRLHGTLMTLADPGPTRIGRRPPLVILVHGSEATSPIHTYRQYLLAAQGVSIFAYDKRGTGASQGVYTQDFDLLADDAAAAVAAARKLAAGHYGRVGLYGGSQGGWIAPKAALLSHADFVEVGFGVVGTPIEQDIWQVDYELTRKLHFPPSILSDVHTITDVTGRIAATDYTQHLDELPALKARYGAQLWFSKIEGQYSGEVLRGELARAKSESPQVPWYYASEPTLKKLRIPQLWVFAEEDSLAVSAPSIRRLQALERQGAKLHLVVYPDTDHGITTFTVDAQGVRHPGAIADGYLRLLADWAKGETRGPYGAAKTADVGR